MRSPTARSSGITRGACLPTSFPGCDLRLLFDVSHNTCKVEPHIVDGKHRQLFVHRKGATRAFGPGHESLPEALRPFGQPVLIGGSMGTGSYVLVGESTAETKAFRRRAMARAVRCPATQRSSNGADARSSTILLLKAS